MTKSKGKSFYIILGETLTEVTFDLDKDTGGWTTVHELIAIHLLKEYNDRERHILMDSHVGMVKRNFYQGKDYVETILKKPVYLIKEPRGKNIKCVTTDPDYHNAKERNFNRIRKNIGNSVKSFLRQTRIAAPEKIKEVERRSKNYISLIENKGDQAT